MDILFGIVSESRHVLTESAPYILFGLFVAGVLKVIVSEDQVSRHLGTGDFKSVVKASIMGVPLPICSCGVMPVAMGLRKQGAGRGATFVLDLPIRHPGSPAD